MGKVTWKGSTLLAPVPAALVSCGTIQEPNMLTIAWTGILCSQPPKTYISIRPERHSYGIIKTSKEFVINLTTQELLAATDFCGVKSGRDTDKFSVCKLTAEISQEVSAPRISQSPLSLECRVTQIIPLGSHDMFMADILAVAVDETLIDEQGKLHLDRSGLIAFAHGSYYELGRHLGTLGYTVRKKPWESDR